MSNRIISVAVTTEWCRFSQPTVTQSWANNTLRFWNAPEPKRSHIKKYKLVWWKHRACLYYVLQNWHVEYMSTGNHIVVWGQHGLPTDKALHQRLVTCATRGSDNNYSALKMYLHSLNFSTLHITRTNLSLFYRDFKRQLNTN